MSVASLVAYALCTLFLLLGFAHYLGVAGTPLRFQEWGLARWWHVPTGLTEIGGAVLIAVPETRPLGYAILLLLLGVLTAALMRVGSFRQSAPPLLAASVLAVLLHHSAM